MEEEDTSQAEVSQDSSQAQVIVKDVGTEERGEGGTKERDEAGTSSKTEEEQIMTLFLINNDDRRFVLFSSFLVSYKIQLFIGFASSAASFAAMCLIGRILV